MHQAWHILRFGFFDELDGRRKVNTQVLSPVVGDRYLKVLNLARILENVRKSWHVQDVANVVFLKLREVLAVRCIAQEKAWKDLNGLAAVRLQRIVGSTFAVGRFRWAATRRIR